MTGTAHERDWPGAASEPGRGPLAEPRAVAPPGADPLASEGDVQYFGIVGSMRSAQARMPPARLRTRRNPASRSCATAFALRAPERQCTTMSSAVESRWRFAVSVSERDLHASPEARRSRSRAARARRRGRRRRPAFASPTALRPRSRARRLAAAAVFRADAAEGLVVDELRDASGSGRRRRSPGSSGASAPGTSSRARPRGGAGRRAGLRLPRISLIVSVAWITPRSPGRIPSTPPSAQDGHEPGRRRLGVEAAVAGSLLRPEDGGLPLEAEDRGVDVGLAGQHAGVVDEVARREVVGSVGDDVEVADDRERVLGGQPLLERHDLDVRVQIRRAAPAAAASFGFPTSDVP